MSQLVLLLAAPLLLRDTAATRAAVDTLAARRCDALAHAEAAAPEAAADVRAALAVHRGAVRWDPARGPVRLWVQPRPARAGDAVRPPEAWRRAVLDAALSWQDVAPGLRFRTTRDSAAADVTVTWAPSLRDAPGDEGLASLTAGRTTLHPAADGRAAAAHVRLAVVAPTGAAYGVADTRAVAVHELGHALGLAHHAAAHSVMAPLVTADRPSDGDRAALRLLYALPVGARCAGSVAGGS